MKNKYLYIILALFVFIPKVIFAVWWNPGTWFDNWTFSKNKVQQVEILEKRINELESLIKQDKNYESDLKGQQKNEGSSLPDKNPVLKNDQNLSNYLFYTAKIGIKVPYPKDYSFTSKLSDKYTIDGCNSEGTNSGYKDGKYVDCVDYRNPDPKSEVIMFGNKENQETVSIVASDYKNYKQNHCQAMLNGNSYTTKSVDGKTLYLVTYPRGQKTYCLDTSDYNFELKSNEKNEIRIDVNRIIFP